MITIPAAAKACGTRGGAGAAAASCAIDPCGLCDARAVAVCGAVDVAELARLAREVEVVGLGAGDVLADEGEPARHVFTITAGAARASKLLPDGRRQVVGFLLKGDFLGLAGADTHTASVEALTPLKACRFPRAGFKRLMAEFPALERRLLGRASADLEAAQEQMLLLGRKTAEERVASFLLNLSRRAERLGVPPDPVALPMGRADIADYLGLTTETVSRVFTRLRKRGLIRLDAVDSVHLARRGELEALAGGG